MRRWTPQGTPETPFRRARQEWDDRLGALAVQAHHWRLAAFILAAAFFVQSAGLIYLGSLPKAQTHVIQVDRLGAAKYLGATPQAAPAPTQESLRYYLRQFIHHTRSTTVDTELLRSWWISVYKFLTPAANNALTAYVQANSPFARAQESRISVEFSAVIPLSRDTWQLDWRELTQDKDGNPVASANWRATARVVIRPLDPERDEQLIVDNPLGIFIDEFHWTRLP